MHVLESYAVMGISEPHLSLSNEESFLIAHSWHFH